MDPVEALLELIGRKTIRREDAPDPRDIPEDVDASGTPGYNYISKGGRHWPRRDSEGNVTRLGDSARRPGVMDKSDGAPDWVGEEAAAAELDAEEARFQGDLNKAPVVDEEGRGHYPPKTAEGSELNVVELRDMPEDQVRRLMQLIQFKGRGNSAVIEGDDAPLQREQNPTSPEELERRRRRGAE